MGSHHAAGGRIEKNRLGRRRPGVDAQYHGAVGRCLQRRRRNDSDPVVIEAERRQMAQGSLRGKLWGRVKRLVAGQ